MAMSARGCGLQIEETWGEGGRARDVLLTCTRWNLGNGTVRILIHRPAPAIRAQQAVVISLGCPLFSHVTANAVGRDHVLLGESHLATPHKHSQHHHLLEQQEGSSPVILLLCIDSRKGTNCQLQCAR